MNSMKNTNAKLPDMQALESAQVAGIRKAGVRAVRGIRPGTAQAHGVSVRKACAGGCCCCRKADRVGRVLARTAREWGLR